MSRRVVLCGGSGFLGSAAAPVLAERGWEVVVLTRTPRPGREGIRFVAWGNAGDDSWTGAIDGAEAVINLAGRNVDCLPTRKNRREILDSRIESVRAVYRAVARAEAPPAVLVQASGVGFYGNAADPCDESAPRGEGFLAETCGRWEDEFLSGDGRGARRAILRIGIVLGGNGGALPRFVRSVRLFKADRLGSGRQYVSWIHLEDMIRMFLHVLESEYAEGTYNATAPHPATNGEMMVAIRKALGVGWGLPMPSLAVRAGALLMGTNPTLALEGQNCVPARFVQEGFDYRYPELNGALEDIMSS